jgi:hypothetical protein
MSPIARTALITASLLALAACSHMPSVGHGKGGAGPAPKPYTQSDDGAGFSLGRKGGGDTAQAGIGVNSYLWRAALDTIAFMPLSSADPFGGVIISDWYTNPQKPDERFKTTVYILDGRLRADALKVAVHKQLSNGTGWVDMPVAPETEIELENAVLARARQLKLSGIAPSAR